ncbi:MAG: AAA family ATPase [Alphaproteobacteria bacterium]|nr:MAG: AAA family ATPase [Alphaproteobacteria bacterium]
MTGAWQDFNDAPDDLHGQTRPKPEERLTMDDLKERLHGRLREALFHLLPQGKVRNGKFTVGDVQGNKGDSLCVELSGAKIGMWHDFATGDGGDILTLWGAVHGWDHQTQFPAIMCSAQEWLGMPARPVPKTVPQEEADDLGPYTGKWDYHDAQGNLIACVYRYDTPDGKEFRPWNVKTRKHKAPEPRPLYNQPGIMSSPAVVLVEGEKCAEALIGKGICATTSMNGANAPVDKTDWSPLIGKQVGIWPDNDDAGKRYADAVIGKLRTLGVASLSILIPPEDKPQGWDVADAVIEGMDVPAFLASAYRITIPPASALPAFTVGHLLDDDSPMPDDLVGPRILTPGGLLVFGGAPKVGKTDLLISWMAHMAAGLPFLGMKPAKPLKIFYLQAEIGYHYLRERLRNLRIDPNFLPLVRRNLVVTPQVRMLLDDKGVEMVRDAITRFFDPNLLDVIAIDPLRNVFDAGENGSENDNTAMLAFLQDRVEKLRFLVNPDAGVILAHHTKKITKKMLEDDPFQALSGAGSLRSFYTTGIILFRSDEQQSLRQLIYELRNGEGVPSKWVDKIDGRWREMEQYSARLVNKDYGERLDNERRRRHDVILQLLFDEGRKGNLYTPTQFCQAFENKGGLGGNHSIRDRIDVLATKGYIKFNKEGTVKSKYGVMCVEGMEVPTGEEVVDQATGEISPAMKSLLPTHSKQSGNGAILPVENPSVWVYPEDIG